jgi:lysophospholipase L1-like esterase
MFFSEPALELQSANIVCDGNSITANGYPSLLAADPFISGKSATVTNLGVSGQHTGQMQADAVTQVDSLISPTRPNILIAWEISNDLYFGRTAQEAIARFRDYCLARKSAGWKVVILSCLDRNQVTDTGVQPAEYRQIINAANALLLASWAEFADQIVDVRKVAGISGLENLPDGVHPNATANQIIKNTDRKSVV